MVITFEVTEQVPEQAVEDLLVTFLDQTMGMYSWWGTWQLEVDGSKAANLGPVMVSRFLLMRDARISITHDDGNSEEGSHNRETILTKELLCTALVKVAKMRKCLVSDLLVNHDTNDADTVLQIALFGEVVFS